jgi:oxaloacetate decarboxylase alpha subunit
VPVEKRPRSSEREAFRLIEDMLQLMESRGLVELELEHQGIRVRLRKASAPGAQVVEYVAGVPGQAAPAASAGPGKAASPEASGRLLVRSPMVGTFYRAPAPDAPAFVEVGQEIEPGQVVCIIEAMKLMNEIKSEVAGRVLEIPVENGEPVEFGQPLLIVEPR